MIYLALPEVTALARDARRVVGRTTMGRMDPVLGPQPPEAALIGLLLGAAPLLELRSAEALEVFWARVTSMLDGAEGHLFSATAAAIFVNDARGFDAEDLVAMTCQASRAYAQWAEGWLRSGLGGATMTGRVKHNHGVPGKPVDIGHDGILRHPLIAHLATPRITSLAIQSQAMQPEQVPVKAAGLPGPVMVVLGLAGVAIALNIVGALTWNKAN